MKKDKLNLVCLSGLQVQAVSHRLNFNLPAHLFVTLKNYHFNTSDIYKILKNDPMCIYIYVHTDLYYYFQTKEHIYRFLVSYPMCLLGMTYIISKISSPELANSIMLWTRILFPFFQKYQNSIKLLNYLLRFSKIGGFKNNSWEQTGSRIFFHCVVHSTLL